MRWLALILALAACADGPSSAAARPGGPRPVKRLVLAATYHRLAVPVAFTHDGRGWIGGVDHDLAVFDGEREVRRYPGQAPGLDDALAAVPGGGWIAGAALLAADGRAGWSGWSLGQRYGRFGSPKASAISGDGAVAIVYAADSPSTCLCDRERGTAGGSAGALVRVSLGSERVTERVLDEHPSRVDYAVAASPTAVAAYADRTLRVWPAAGDGSPITATIAGTTLGRLAWASDRYLIATRYVDLDRTDVLVLDRDAGWQPAWTWPVPGTLRDLQVRPGGREVAVAWDNYRATDRVLRDDRKVAVVRLDGTRAAELDTRGHPASVAWSPRGDALLVATTDNDPAGQLVLRYQVR